MVNIPECINKLKWQAITIKEQPEINYISLCQDDTDVLRLWMELSRITKGAIPIEELNGDRFAITPLVIADTLHLDLMLLIYFPVRQNDPGGYSAIFVKKFIKNQFNIGSWVHMMKFNRQEITSDLMTSIVRQISALAEEGLVHECISAAIHDGFAGFIYPENFAN